MSTVKTSFHVAIKSRRKELKLSVDEVAAEAQLSIDLPGGGRRDGGVWLRGLEAGKAAQVDRATCNRLETVLSLEIDHLWGLLLQDDRKVDPEVRAYYEGTIQELASHLDTPFEYANLELALQRIGKTYAGRTSMNRATDDGGLRAAERLADCLTACMNAGDHTVAALAIVLHQISVLDRASQRAAVAKIIEAARVAAFATMLETGIALDGRTAPLPSASD